MTQADRDRKTKEERFAKIREFFLAYLEGYGNARKELYNRPKLGDAREPTEQEIVERWAGDLRVELNDILFGIQTAFEEAPARGNVVTSFRYVVPHIVKRIAAMADARVGRR